MITLRHEFEISSEPPVVYLDHWALRRLSENATLGHRFLDAFTHRGTVAFSLMNVCEIADTTHPETSGQIRDFLEKLGPYWVPMTVDPLPVLKAEDSNTNSMSSCVSEAFLNDPWFLARLKTGIVSLTHVVDLTRGTNGAVLKSVSVQQRAPLLKDFQHWRDRYRRNPKDLDIGYPPTDFDAARPMRAIYNGLVRSTIKGSFTLNDNHARDLFHAVVSVRCADLVTLDAHWAEQVRKLKLPADFVHVYSERRQPDLRQFLADFEASPATR